MVEREAAPEKGENAAAAMRAADVTRCLMGVGRWRWRGRETEDGGGEWWPVESALSKRAHLPSPKTTQGAICSMNPDKTLYIQSNPDGPTRV